MRPRLIAGLGGSPGLLDAAAQATLRVARATSPRHDATTWTATSEVATPGSGSRIQGTGYKYIGPAVSSTRRRAGCMPSRRNIHAHWRRPPRPLAVRASETRGARRSVQRRPDIGPAAATTAPLRRGDLANEWLGIQVSSNLRSRCDTRRHIESPCMARRSAGTKE